MTEVGPLVASLGPVVVTLGVAFLCQCVNCCPFCVNCCVKYSCCDYVGFIHFTKVCHCLLFVVGTLSVTKGIATSRTLLVAPGITTSNKKLLVTRSYKCII